MKFTSWFHYIWKVPLCGLVFFFGFIPGAQLAALIGLPALELPAGSDQATIAQYTLLASLILALGLAAVSSGLSKGFLSRWLILFFFTWIGYGVNTYLEAAIFSTMQAASLYTVVLFLPASLLCAAAIAWLFPPDLQGGGFLTRLRDFFGARSWSSWTWRLLAVFLAFPLVYLAFGTLIAPIVMPYYQAGTNQLRLPGWDQILPVAALRSLFFMLACLPVVVAWQRSNRSLFLSLGLALFILVGGLSMIEAYWLTPVLRITHSLEIFADEMVYAAALTLLLHRPLPLAQNDQRSAPAGSQP